MYVCHCGEVALCGHDVFLVLLRRTEESRLCRVRIGYNPSGLTAPLIKPASTARRAFLSRPLVQRWSDVIARYVWSVIYSALRLARHVLHFARSYDRLLVTRVRGLYLFIPGVRCLLLVFKTLVKSVLLHR